MGSSRTRSRDMLATGLPSRTDMNIEILNDRSPKLHFIQSREHGPHYSKTSYPSNAKNFSDKGESNISIIPHPLWSGGEVGTDCGRFEDSAHPRRYWGLSSWCFPKRHLLRLDTKAPGRPTLRYPQCSSYLQHDTQKKTSVAKDQGVVDSHYNLGYSCIDVFYDEIDVLHSHPGRSTGPFVIEENGP